MGYVAQGELHLTSRAKDLIIRGGHNIHPYELEGAVGNLPGVRRGGVAVFAAADPGSATERVVVLAETRETDAERRAALRDRISGLAIDLLGGPADDIVLAGAHTVRKTSSGKIRRAVCRELYEKGLLQSGAKSVAAQVARLWLDALLRRAREPLRAVAAAVYGAWSWALFGVGAALGVATALLPSCRLRKQAARSLARALLHASRLPVSVEGGALIPRGPVVLVANHASFIDWLLLTAVLPATTSFVAKKELAKGRAMRWLLRRVGTRFVARGDARQGVEDAKALVRAARAGESLVFFPEGTLRREPGLLPFHMGAFVVSAQSGLPLLPVTLRGTRGVMRDGSWRPRREAVQVCIHEALRPPGSDWRAAVQLRDAARKAIAADCAEPLVRLSREAPPGP